MHGRARLALARRDPALAVELIDRLSTSDRDDTATHDTPRPVPTPRAALVRAAALTSQARYGEAEELLLGTRDVLEWQGGRNLLWRCHLALADLLAASGRHDDAERAYVTARQAVEELAAGLDDPRLRDQFLRRALRRLPRGYHYRASAGTPGGPLDGLTPREREVAAMIASGHTNREIAEALVLGERTIETHVSNVLGKLGLGSRREMARWAADHGLSAR
jgi:DNA-binding CsgD family transcriptional regulator